MMCVCHCMCILVGRSPYRKIFLQGIAHPVVGKTFSGTGGTQGSEIRLREL